ncbi:hypothetical protein EDC96DRAFT_545587 [Choanephora cucurbitarum]|nr:hypothetical protein EDC96DRAFT_545587 [Choanephora cucurbitarum]
MDFASTPFQDLLIQNAGQDQLLGFLKQLDEQYRNATDETSRLGTLQIVLPMLKAHLLHLNNAEAEDACLEEYLKPWIILAMTQDASVSAESIQLLIKSTAWMMARSMVSQHSKFGQQMLLLLLQQLILAMELEPDFVDLKPLDLVESNLKDDKHADLWDQLKQLSDQDATNTTTLHLDYCLAILNQFVRDLNEHEEFKEFEQEGDKLGVWMHTIFTVAVAMIPCTDVGMRNKLGHDLLPNLLRWQSKLPWTHQVKWCTMLWDRTLEIYALPATNLLRLEIYGLIARFFDSYFGIDRTGQVRHDLRFDVNFFRILQSGLQSTDSLARKYSTYILKRIIDFTEKNPDLSNQPWTPFFSWDYTQSQQYLEHWDDWFLLYDIMHESVIHLVEPVLPRFETLIRADLLDASWWILLFYRGFQNDVASVKKGLLEFIFSRQQPDVLQKMGVQHMFIFGALLKTLDVASLFQVPTQGTFVSPFGEHFKSFLVHVIESFDQEQDKISFLCQLMHHLSHVVSSYVPILYSMEALTEITEVRAWGPDELKSLRVLVDRHRNFNIPATKQFLRKLGIMAIIRLANTSILSFSDVAKTISSLVNEYPVKPEAKEFKLLHYWLENKVSKDMSLDSILHGLRDRIKTYILDLDSEDIPEAVLRTQANVLARISVFVASNSEGQLVSKHLTELFDLLTQQLSTSTVDDIMFSRLLTLLNALWENFEVTFESKATIAELIGLDHAHLGAILNRIDKYYLNVGEDNVVDEDLVRLYLSLTKRILLGKTALESKQREQLIYQYYGKCIEFMKYRNHSGDANHEMSKPAYLTLLSTLYIAAKQFDYFELDCDDVLVSLVYQLQMKRTQEALRERTWGDSLSTFIRCKWECIENIVRYSSEVQSRQLDKPLFDPVALYDEAIDQLESSSEMCGEAIIRSFGPLLALPWEKTPEMVMNCIDYATALMKENAAQSKTYPLLMRAFIDVLFQPQLLSIPELNEGEESPVKKALHMVLQVGELKPYIVAQATKLLHDYWSQFTPETDQSMLQYASEIAQLAVFGPLRDREDQKLEAAFATKLASATDINEAEGTAQSVFSQNDYLVRVYINDLLLRFDLNNKTHTVLANDLMDHLFRIVNEDILYEFMYMSTIEHRLKLRVCCSIMLIIDFATEDRLDHYFEQYFELMRKETVTSVRCYVEWALVRLLARYPRHLPTFYQRLTDSSHKPNFVISLLTVTFTLCDILPDAHAKPYFEDIFKQLMPWLITNHFTIRLFSFCAWQRNYKACLRRGFGKGIEDDKYIQSMNAFMDSYVDCIKYWDKLQQQFYMTKFDPVADYNIEFIFRQMLAEFDVIENERIGSKSFIRVNPSPVERCPFDNPARHSVYTSADPSELIATQDETKQNQTGEEDNLAEDVFQKKIMPWEMMLETDMDLTKNIVQQKRKRNDLIVVASLIDRLPNLAGLCRTCEIFNASTLVVPSLKIKEDIGFTTVSVASEKWMPMTEVTEADLPAFLQQKKDEGYTLCGLEQTTTSATLGTYQFPEKCVLLLGKERQGVPAALLQMLDVTIEIPQYGITRSLNVHVSGAICIYEYTKQMQWRQQASITTTLS